MQALSAHASRPGHQPIAVTVKAACHISGLGKTKLFELIGSGRLDTVAVGKRRLVIYASIERLLDPKARDAQMAEAA
jgi:hypothetical protein